MNQLTDDKLVRMCKQGKEIAFEQLITRYNPLLFKYVYSYTNDKQLAEDIVQEIFIKMITNIEKYDWRIGSKFSTWLYKIAYNTVVDEYRKKKIQNTIYLDDDKEYILQEVDSVEKIIIENDKTEKVQLAIEGLPPELKAIIYLRYYMNFSYKEISNIMKFPIKKVKWRLHDAIIKMKKILSSKEVVTNEK